MADVRTLKLRDMPWVYHVIKQGGLQDPLFAKTHAFSPVGLAALSLLSGVGIGTSTFVANPEEKNSGRGIAQLRHRGNRGEADLLFMAPRLEREAAKGVWMSLLGHASRQMQSEGIIRLYARPPAEGPEAHLFREAGFSLYARETILELKPGKRINQGKAVPLEMTYGCSNWHLWKLYVDITPPIVQWADGATSGEAPYGWDCLRGQAISWNEKGTLLGAMQISPCRKGCLLYVLLREPPPEESDAFLRQGLEVLGVPCSKPVYVSVRSYQPCLRRALEGIGFEPIGEFISAVKQIAVWQTVPERVAQTVEGSERVIAGLSPSHMHMVERKHGERVPAGEIHRQKAGVK